MNALTPLSLGMSVGICHGRLMIHSAPKALCSHINWSIADVFGVPFSGEWKNQPLVAGSYRLDLPWQGRSGVAAKLASALAGWEFLRFEVVQSGFGGSDGELYRFTPQLKMHFSTINSLGEIVISEDQILSTISRNREPALLSEKLHELLGSRWDHELEPFRIALGEAEFNFEDKITV